MSDFYTCNGTKQKKYLKERRGQELNDEKQQEVVDKQLAEQFGLEEQATAFTRLAKRVVSQIGESPVPDILKSSVNAPTVSIKDKLSSLIKSGTLSTWFDKISKISNTANLSRSAKIVLNDIKNPETRAMITGAFNDRATEIITKLGNLDESVSSIEKALVDIVAGGRADIIRDLDSASEAGSFSGSEGELESKATTAASTIAELQKDLPNIFGNTELEQKSGANRLMNIAKNYNDPNPIYIKLKSESTGTKGTFKNLKNNLQLKIQNNDIGFATYHSTGGYKDVSLDKVKNKLSDLNTKQLALDLTKLSSELST